MQPAIYYSNSVEETFELGRNLSETFRPGMVVGFTGDLGAGKTHLIKGICNGLRIPLEDVSSPTFAIIQQYEGKFLVFHADFYRIDSIEELYDIGWVDYLTSGGIILIEWFDLFLEALPANRIEIKLEVLESDQRKITVYT